VAIFFLSRACWGGSAFVFVGGHHLTHVTTAENRRK
jgi:hypothetical protein